MFEVFLTAETFDAKMASSGKYVHIFLLLPKRKIPEYKIKNEKVGLKINV
jgi:hypothetical protein